MPARHRARLHPCVSKSLRVHACMRTPGTSVTSRAPAFPTVLSHVRPYVRAPDRASEQPPAPMHASARPAVNLSLPERASFAPEPPSKRSTESPDSRTIPRLFPRIPRLGIKFST
ncbi:hypothetical protein CRG98_014585 [Punica granatum]|uniref:Uncharacterized protein n=1 Tax=Punica granatum TaxID=22663 RepID=A0A2I0KA04_PUNGR|nr:hypothetical protein CRG98_014585 [Punica granatum]